MKQAWTSKLKELTDMLWAPYVLEGEQGTTELVYTLLQNPSFTYNEIFSPSQNPAVIYLQEKLNEYQHIMEKEIQRFEKKKTVKDIFLIYEPEGSELRLSSKLSSILCDLNPDHIIIFRTRSSSIKGSYKYSLRRGNLKVNLAKIAEETAKKFPPAQGGGHPEAAGAYNITDAEAFEEEFMEATKRELRNL